MEDLPGRDRLEQASDQERLAPARMGMGRVRLEDLAHVLRERDNDRERPAPVRRGMASARQGRPVHVQPVTDSSPEAVVAMLPGPIQAVVPEEAFAESHPGAEAPEGTGTGIRIISPKTMTTMMMDRKMQSSLRVLFLLFLRGLCSA